MSSDREIINDGTIWGFVDAAGMFNALPKAPLVQGGFTPPCDVTLPSGDVRHVVTFDAWRLEKSAP